MNKTISGILTGFLITFSALNSYAENTVIMAGKQTWEVKAPKNDQVQISQEGDSLKVKFKVKIDKKVQRGNWTYNESTFQLLLKNPIALNEKIDRIIFEGFGYELKTWNSGEKTIQFWPLLKDKKGELHAYIPKKYPLQMRENVDPHLKKKTYELWGKYMTSTFYCGEAGGATQDIYESEGGDGNCWPDGKLTFMGFKVILRESKPGVKEGAFAVGEIEFSGEKQSSNAPFLYADNVFSAKGKYHFMGSVATKFQALPVIEFDQEIAFDPDSLDNRRQKLLLPLPEGNSNFWISYQLNDSAGKMLFAKNMRHETTDAKSVCQAKSVNPELPPPSAYMRINPDRNGNGVYEQSESPEITVRVFPKQQKNLDLEWTLLEYAHDTRLGEGSQKIDTKQKFKDIKITPKMKPGRDAYRIKLTLKSASKKIDEKVYVFGKKTDVDKVFFRKGKTIDRHQVKKASYNRCTFITLSYDKPKTADEMVRRFEQIMDEAGPLTKFWSYSVDPAEMEILPGVYDFSVLDKIMDAATDRGVYLTLMICHTESKSPYTWLPYSHQHSFDGLPIDEHYYGGYSLGDENYLEFWYRLNKNLYQRYKQHPAFQGYYLLEPAGEFAIEDKPWEGIVAGYEKPMEDNFRKYLQEKLKLTLESLNKRWQTSYKSWSEVLPPKPNFKLKNIPDLSMKWVDFNNFKINLDEAGWFPVVVSRIREYAPNHVVIVYAGSKVADLVTGQADYLHNGGNHYNNAKGEFVNAWEKGKTGWISEPHHPHRWAEYGDPAEKGWVLDWTIWIATAQAGGGGANLHLYYLPQVVKTLQKHYGLNYAYDRYKKYQPILDELSQSSLVDYTPQTGVMQDRLTLSCKHRTTFSPRLDDLKRWFELLETDGIAYGKISNLKDEQLKLLLPNVLDEVMSEKNIEKLDDLVRNKGCKLIMTAITGKYCPQRGNAPWQLLKQLGITPPAGEYVQNEPGVQATVVTENPLFPKGSEVDFYTLAQYKKDLQSPEIKKAFWKFPYRWLPQTDYFGYFKNNHKTNGKVWAKFASGAPAITVHKVGKGEVVVFWGIPDYRPAKLGGFMTKATKWAGVANPLEGNPIPYMVETHSKSNGRHYALLFDETPGVYTQKIVKMPEGKWFVSDLVSDRKLGTYSGKYLRKKGIELTFLPGASPLQVLRFIPIDKHNEPKWAKKYPSHL